MLISSAGGGQNFRLNHSPKGSKLDYDDWYEHGPMLQSFRSQSNGSLRRASIRPEHRWLKATVDIAASLY
jgi:hypothetical protein